MYKNLMAELAKREMSLEELSKEMGIKQEMLLLKMEAVMELILGKL